MAEHRMWGTLQTRGTCIFYMYICMHIFLDTHLTGLHIYIYIHTHKCMYMCLHGKQICIYVYIHIYIHMYIHIYIYICISRHVFVNKVGAQGLIQGIVSTVEGLLTWRCATTTVVFSWEQVFRAVNPQPTLGCILVCVIPYNCPHNLFQEVHSFINMNISALNRVCLMLRNVGQTPSPRNMIRVEYAPNPGPYIIWALSRFPSCNPYTRKSTEDP